MNLYDRILMLCDERNISVRSLERSCGMSHGVVRRWNERMPSADRVKRVADYFGVTVTFLLGFDREAEYYIEPEVSRITQDMKDRPILKEAFDALRNLSDTDIELLLNMIERMK